MCTKYTNPREHRYWERKMNSNEIVANYVFSASTTSQSNRHSELQTYAVNTPEQTGL